MMVPKQLVILLIYIRPVIGIFWLICLLSPLLGCTQEVGPGNLALNKTYTLSVSPNCPGTMGNDLRDLTDGKFRTGAGFWTNSSCVGWQNIQTVSIEVDLGRAYNIDKVGINTARGLNANVLYPNSALIFLSDNKNEYYYAGDAMLSLDNTIGDYQVKTFFLNNISHSGRYIKVVLRGNSPFIFIDEIMVFQSKDFQNRILSNDKLIAGTKLPQKIDSVVNDNNSIKKVLFNIIEGLNILEGMTNLPALKMELQSLSLNDSSQLKLLENQLKDDVVNETMRRFPHAPFIIKSRNAWSNWKLSALSSFSNGPISFAFSGIKGAHEYAAIEIVNTKDRRQDIPIKTTVLGISLFEVPPSPGIANFVYDALLPVSDVIKLNPGEHKFVFFKIPVQQNNTKGEIRLGEGGEVTIPVSIKALHPTITKGFLNANVWGYLNYPYIRDHKSAIAKDLAAHDINVINPDPINIPVIGNLNFENLTENLNHFSFSNFSKVMLFYNFRNLRLKSDMAGNAFMSDRWKANFKMWYTNLLSSLNKLGITREQVYFHPYDEIKDTEIDDFIRFSKWVKQDVPELNLYLTINSKKGLDAVPYTDIAQIVENYASVRKNKYANKEIWSYQALRFSRELNPYNDYRLLGWKAFINGWRGVGFWNYLDLNRQNKSNNYHDFVDFPGNDYSIIYTGKNEIYSSRRWEAYSRGIWDYAFINIFADKFGRRETTKYVERVLMNKAGFQLADSVICELLINMDL